MDNKKYVIGLGVAAVGFAALAAWMYQSKWKHEKDFLNGKTDNPKTPEDEVLKETPKMTAYLAFAEPPPSAQPYGCGSYMKDCVAGEVGGCEQYKQTCVSLDNSVRMTMARPGECDQFRRQCEMGDYTSCDLYNRGCLHETD